MLEAKSREVDEALLELLNENPNPVPNLHEGMLYALGLDQPDSAARGKRVRPALCLIACEALGGDNRPALAFAMAVELMHNFFLVHDDIQDGDTTRRGRPSVWRQYGVAHGINIGDFLFTHVYLALGHPRLGVEDPALRCRLTDLLNFTLERTHVGQALDMNALQSSSITQEEYLEIVTNKTGYYLAAPMLAGAICAGAGEETLESLQRLGRYVGPVFQVVDDTIDLTHGKGRETTGSDIREGKRSWLVAHAAAHAAPEEREELFRILNLPREETGPAEVEKVRTIFDRTHAVEGSRNYCRELMAQAEKEARKLPEPLQKSLWPLFTALLERKK